MEKFNCIIVEDEPLAAEVLQDYIAQVPFLELKAVCADAIYAMEVMQKEKIEAVFLDIHLPRLKGLDFIKTLSHPPQIIITSAYRDYAIEGYELNVTDYLVKPINFNRFLTAVNKLKTQLPQLPGGGNITNASPERLYLFFNVNKKRIKVYLDEILYIESKREYIDIVTKSRSLLTKLPLGEVEELLTKNNFIRVHRSFIVAKQKIDAFTAAEVEINGKEIPIGRNYKELVAAMLSE
ncbi:MAG TPA: LytTR family DNA-binding domain-containing protein [Chitinophagaceae bacterium]|jgi:DNA-binding LytR/AlgR family response regulator|nr:LytTR family DNA-binding domain-containing protein [Chitinophagaceae bacterium]